MEKSEEISRNRQIYCDNYEKRMAWLRAHPGLLRAVVWSNRILEALFYLAYAWLILIYALELSYKLAILLAVPGLAFIAISILRWHFDEPRPYDYCNTEPAIPREDTGKSLPSRHVFSAATIATAWVSTSPVVAGILMALVVLLACIRVYGGVHFPRDVVAGGLLGAACGLIASILCIML